MQCLVAKKEQAPFCFGGGLALALLLAFVAAFCLPATLAHAGEPTKGGKVTKVSTGFAETAYVTSDGVAYLCGAVGYDTEGDIGNCDTPVRIPFDGKIVDVAVANCNCIFLDDAGNLYIYGKNQMFEEQNGNYVEVPTSFKKTPMKIDSGVSKIAMGGSSYPTAAYVKNGELYTFSLGSGGTVQNSNESLLCRNVIWSKDRDNGCFTDNSNVPTKADFDTGKYGKIADVFVNRCNNIAAVITENGDLYAWGNNQHGELATGSLTSDQSKYWVPTPQKVASNVKKVDAADKYLGYLTNSGEIYFTGFLPHYLYKRNGELGIETGDTTWYSTPVKYDDGFSDFFLEQNHMGFVTTEGSLYTWGTCGFGKLGNGDENAIRFVEIPEKVLDDAAAIFGGMKHTVCLKKDGTLVGFGSNGSGQTIVGPMGDVGNNASPVVMHQAHEHTVVNVDAVAATCVTSGSNAGTKCSECGEILSGCEEIPATGKHVEDAGTVTSEATCSVAGEKLFKCKTCGKELRKETIPATGEHTWQKDAASSKAATCTEPGTDHYVCSVCEATEDKLVQALGHDYKTTKGKAATCTEKGVKDSKECTRCHDKQGGEEIPALGHDWKQSKAAVAATCTKNGSTAVEKCSRCDRTKGGDAIKALGHNLKSVAAKEATCTKKGHSAYKECTRCDYKEGYKELATISHDYGIVSKPYIPPTYLKDGMSEERKCSMCGKVTEKATKIPRLPAKNQSVTVKTSVKTASKSKLKKKAQVVSGSISVKNAKGKITYAKVSGSSKLSINKTNGKVTVKKKTKKGTYSFKVKVSVGASSNGEYKATSRTVTVKIKVA